MGSEREAFLSALAENPDDTVTRLVFSDFLDEHDEPEEAARQRAYPAAREWMTNWVRSINYGAYKEDEHGNDILDENGDPILDPGADNLGDPHTLEYAIYQGHGIIRGEGSYWSSDAGADFFRNAPKERLDEWLSNWSILTGVEIPGSGFDVRYAGCSC
jgi:uncharacterized protein (TIGR02996 family)